MKGYFQALGFCSCKCVAEYADITLSRISTEVDAYHAGGPVFKGQINHFLGLGSGISPIDGQDEICPHARARLSVVRIDDSENRLDIVFFGEACRGSGGRPKLQVDDAI